MISNSADQIGPIFFDSSFEASSSDLTEYLPVSVVEQIVAVAEFEKLLLAIDEKLFGIAVAKRVDHFLHLVACAVLEGRLDQVLVSFGTLDFEDGFRLRSRSIRLISTVASPVGIGIVPIVSSASVLAVSRHCLIPGLETLAILIKMSYSLWTRIDMDSIVGALL